MLPEDFFEFIKNEREAYKKIGHVECPAFQGDKIYFNQHGFKHILRKGHEMRTMHQQIRRLSLLKYARQILEESTTFTHYRKVEKIAETKNGLENSIAYFWSFEKNIENKVVVVVVCKINKQSLKFISIMDKNQ